MELRNIIVLSVYRQVQQVQNLLIQIQTRQETTRDGGCILPYQSKHPLHLSLMTHSRHHTVLSGAINLLGSVLVVGSLQLRSFTSLVGSGIFLCSERRGGGAPSWWIGASGRTVNAYLRAIWGTKCLFT